MRHTHLFAPPNRAEKLRLYQFNEKIAQHFFCEVCGIHTYSHPRTAPENFNVNVRCLDEFDLAEAGYEMSLFDGRNWEDAFEAMKAARRE